MRFRRQIPAVEVDTTVEVQQAIRENPHLPNHQDDVTVRRAIEAISATSQDPELAKAMHDALTVTWVTLARYAAGNRRRVMEVKRQIRIVFIALGLLLIGIGVLEWRISDVHHQDTQQLISSLKHSGKASTRKAFYLSAFASCQRNNKRSKAAQRKVNAAPPNVAAIAGPLLLSAFPYRSNCVGFAHGQVTTVGLSPSKSR
jgi:hypothetical protein